MQHAEGDFLNTWWNNTNSNKKSLMEKDSKQKATEQKNQKHKQPQQETNKKTKMDCALLPSLSVTSLRSVDSRHFLKGSFFPWLYINTKSYNVEHTHTTHTRPH